MSTSLYPDHWKPRETTGEHSPQRHLSLHGEAPPPRRLDLLPPGALVRASFNHTLQQAVLMSGMDQERLAKRIAISKGYMTKFLSGVTQQWARRLVRFMEETGSLAPLQWMAAQVGCEVVQLDARAAEVAALQARLNELTRAA